LSKYCSYDKRTNIYYEGTDRWFIDHFSDEQTWASTNDDCPVVPNIIENGDDVYDDDDGNVNFESDEVNDDDKTSKVENTYCR